MFIPIEFAGREFLPFSLSPMAGITNAPFRQICHEFAERGAAEVNGLAADGTDSPNLAKQTVEPGLYIDEMAAARAVSGHIKKVRAKITFAPNEHFRSMQLYCREPEYAYKAAYQVAKENLADHIDLNFGCPVRKVTSNGGGSAIPLRPKLLRAIIRAVQDGAREGVDARISDAQSSNHSKQTQPIPVTAKFRSGLDDDTIIYPRTAEIAVEEGCKLLTLHARTTAQYYAGQANWQHIKHLREICPKDVLVFGNGDVWSFADAKRMQEETGCDGVAVGRGSLGKPWIFYELASGKPYRPNLGEVIEIMLRHLHLTMDWMHIQHKEKNSELVAMRAFRANIGHYLKGFPVGKLKVQIMQANTYQQLKSLLNQLDKSAPYPSSVEAKPRGRTKSVSKVFLPANWLSLV